ncbi:conserved hypothetical protein [Ahrensia sp. R2A130]|nr:conserved hypothetical protein [Ahrensia sp. R2A130]
MDKLRPTFTRVKIEAEASKIETGIPKNQSNRLKIARQPVGFREMLV